MKVVKTDIPDVLIFEPKVFGDERGFFFESFNQKIFEEAVGRKVEFVQDNHSKSHRGVLRGLHFQKRPYAQGKLVFDVAVDMRKDSPTFGHWVGVYISATNKRQLWIPEGFAHGFLALSDTVEFLYKTTDYYHTESEVTIAWNDPELNVNWGIKENPQISEKDTKGISLKQYKEEK